MADLRESLQAAAGGKAAGPEDVVGAVQAALSDSEWQHLLERAKEAVRAEITAKADWLWWGELGRRLAPKLLAREGAKGVSLVCEAAKESGT